jgi:serine/threonine protein kinase
LGFLHSRGLIHRDVKPSNIVFVNGIPKLADIGLVAETSEARSYVGTDGFIPPEGPSTVAADIYSLGKVLYEISTGKDRHDYPELPSYLGDIPPGEWIQLNKIILKACRADPQQRYKSAGAMAADLRVLCGPPLAIQKSFRWKAVLIAGTVAIGLGGVVALWQRRPEAVPGGLLGGWKADDSADDTTGIHHGSLIAEMDSFQEGIVGKAFHFNGSNQCVRIPYSESLISSNFSVEAWINPFDYPSHVITRQSLIFGQSFGQVQFVIRSGIKGVRVAVQFGTDDLTFYEIQSANEIPIRQFSHVAGTWDGSELRLFINGVLNAQSVPRVSPVDSRCAFFIGGLYSAETNNCYYIGQFFNGLIDEIRFFGRSLSAAEIQASFEGSSPVQPSEASPNRDPR